MHENRIAGLQNRLRTLDIKAAAGYNPAAILRDRIATTEELTTLLGIQQRYAALQVEAPIIAAADAALALRARRFREQRQYTPGAEAEAVTEGEST